jgi:poly(3-hydroxybutyrate) depolymerase
MPLMVVLHGCTQTADSVRQLTRFDQLAEAKGFIVVSPSSRGRPTSRRAGTSFWTGICIAGAVSRR